MLLMLTVVLINCSDAPAKLILQLESKSWSAKKSAGWSTGGVSSTPNRRDVPTSNTIFCHTAQVAGSDVVSVLFLCVLERMSDYRVLAYCQFCGSIVPRASDRIVANIDFQGRRRVFTPYYFER